MVSHSTPSQTHISSNHDAPDCHSWSNTCWEPTGTKQACGSLVRVGPRLFQLLLGKRLTRLATPSGPMVPLKGNPKAVCLNHSPLKHFEARANPSTCVTVTVVLVGSAPENPFCCAYCSAECPYQKKALSGTKCLEWNCGRAAFLVMIRTMETCTQSAPWNTSLFFVCL